MTRQNYVALAAALASVRPAMEGPVQTPVERQWVDCVRAIGDVCKADNPRFDQSRFALACLA